MRRSPLTLRKQFVRLLQRHPDGLTYGQIERKLNTNSRTVRTIAEEFAWLGIVTLTTSAQHPANHRRYTRLTLTPYGQRLP